MKIFCGDFYLSLEVKEKSEILEQVYSAKEIFELITQKHNTKECYTLHFSSLSSLGNFYQELSRFFCIVPAAGGIVITPSLKVLLIYRRGKWDLPKGKIDNDESAATAAQREVQEETGIQGIRLVSFLYKTYHIYEQKAQWFLKPTAWYIFYCSQEDQSFTPQQAEEIEEVKWFELQELNLSQLDTYATIREILMLLRHKYL
ncbi:MAG: NUDIX domain-containing protein [Bacteroidia bacterium]|nr:NUDIX domain-containing protein [Bacteroidia bacterium]MDW8158933.1 NUDIX domain-containing protein [Bacteroidia bacterium]